EDALEEGGLVFCPDEGSLVLEEVDDPDISRTSSTSNLGGKCSSNLAESPGLEIVHKGDDHPQRHGGPLQQGRASLPRGRALLRGSSLFRSSRSYSSSALTHQMKQHGNRGSSCPTSCSTDERINEEPGGPEQSCFGGESGAGVWHHDRQTNSTPIVKERARRGSFSFSPSFFHSKVAPARTVDDGHPP
ncbi:unnamed protein product, partial [Amoebophrya sp. A25]